MSKLVQIIETSSRSRQVCLSVFFLFQFVVYNQKLIWDSDKTNRFHVAVGLFSNRSQKTSKYGKNIGDTHLDVICDILLNGTDARQH